MGRRVIEPISLVQVSQVDNPRLVAYLRNRRTLAGTSAASGGGADLGDEGTAGVQLRFEASEELLEWLTTCPVTIDSSQFANRIYEQKVARVIETYQTICRELIAQFDSAVADTKYELKKPPTMPPTTVVVSNSSDGKAVLVPHGVEGSHAGLSLVCSFCRKTYNSSDRLQRHTLMKHNPHQPTEGEVMLVKAELNAMREYLNRHLLERTSYTPHTAAPTSLSPLTAAMLHGTSQEELEVRLRENQLTRYAAESAAMYNFRASHNELMVVLGEQRNLLNSLERRLSVKHDEARNRKSKHVSRKKEKEARNDHATEGQAPSRSPSPFDPSAPPQGRVVGSRPSTPPPSLRQPTSPRLRFFTSPTFTRNEVERLAMAQRALIGARDLVGY